MAKEGKTFSKNERENNFFEILKIQNAIALFVAIGGETEDIMTNFPMQTDRHPIANSSSPRRDGIHERLESI